MRKAISLGGDAASRTLESLDDALRTVVTTFRSRYKLRVREGTGRNRMTLVQISEGFMRIVSAVVVTAALALPVAALAADRPQRQNPYASLFTGQVGSQQTPSVPTPAPAPFLPFAQPPNMVQPTPQFTLPAQIVKCGMTIQQGDAKIDPKMLKPLPPNTPKPSIAIVPAPACQK